MVIDPERATCTINIRYPYEVDLDRIRDERGLLQCALHLLEKNWMTPEHLAFFIRRVADFKKFDLHKGSPDFSRN